MDRPGTKPPDEAGHGTAERPGRSEQRPQEPHSPKPGRCASAVLCIEVQTEQSARPAVGALLSRLLKRELPWASVMERHGASTGDTPPFVVLVCCPLPRALQTARLLRLMFRIEAASFGGSGQAPDLYIGMALAEGDCDPGLLARLARDACESARQRGPGSICIRRIHGESEVAI